MTFTPHQDNKITSEILEERMNWSLDKKIYETNHRLEQWYNYWRMENRGIYISFSGGKDSTVLLHLVRSNPFLKKANIPAVFCDTGMEYPEIREFVKTIEDITWIRPKMPFTQVIEKYGYPVVSKEVSQQIHEIRTTKSDKLRNKRLYGDGKSNLGKLSEKWKFLLDAPFKISDKCCSVMKKEPFKKYEKETGRVGVVGTMITESRTRRGHYYRNGCNAFTLNRPRSAPMSFWTEEDVWNYIQTYNVQYASIYDKGLSRTGCMFCAFGAHKDKCPNRYQIMKNIHPYQYEYCMNRLEMKKVLKFLDVEYE